MFSAASQQGEPRRQSYKVRPAPTMFWRICALTRVRPQSFTRGLLNASELEEAASHRAKHPDTLETVPEEGVWNQQTRSRLPTSSSAQTHLSTSGSTTSLSTTGSNAHLASASLILGETASLHPKLPRVMSNAVPSYAYGAPSTNKERPTHTRAPRGSLGGDEGSIDGRSSLRGGKSRARDNDDDAGSGSVSLLAGNEPSPEAASVRYARLKQRLQNTGSPSVPEPPPSAAMNPAPATTSAPPTKPSSTGTIRKNPKPTAVGSRDTSVNLAVAIQQAEARRKAALASAPSTQPAAPAPSTLDQPSFEDGSYEMEIDLRDPDATAPADHLPDGEDGSAVKETHTVSPNRDGDTSLTGSKKRKKGRKSGHVVLDPTYKYRPDDEFSSDSEAGEGLAGGKGKRNAKAPDRSLPGEGSGLGENKRPKKKARKSGEVARGDSETGSDVDTGEGIAKSRSRRSLANPNGSGEGRSHSLGQCFHPLIVLQAQSSKNMPPQLTTLGPKPSPSLVLGQSVPPTANTSTRTTRTKTLPPAPRAVGAARPKTRTPRPTARRPISSRDRPASRAPSVQCRPRGNLSTGPSRSTKATRSVSRWREGVIATKRRRGWSERWKRRRRTRGGDRWPKRCLRGSRRSRGSPSCRSVNPPLFLRSTPAPEPVAREGGDTGWAGRSGPSSGRYRRYDGGIWPSSASSSPFSCVSHPHLHRLARCSVLTTRSVRELVPIPPSTAPGGLRRPLDATGQR